MKTYGLKFGVKVHSNAIEYVSMRYYKSLTGAKNAVKYFKENGLKCTLINLSTGEVL